MKRNATEGQVAAFSRGFTGRQIVVQAPLKDGQNAFRFVLQDGKGDAWVNGSQVFATASPEKNVQIYRNCLLGLGAYNDMNETMIRYRNIRVRQLRAESSSTQP